MTTGLLHHLRKYGVVEVKRFGAPEDVEPGYMPDFYDAGPQDRYGHMHYRPVKPLKQIRKRERKK